MDLIDQTKDVVEEIRQKVAKLHEFEARIAVLENQLRERQYQQLLARVEKLEQWQRERDARGQS